MAPVRVVPISQSPPLNSVHLILDGTEDQVLLNYIYCQEYYCNWNIELATDKVEILRDNSNVFNVFTTPTRSTFYYAMTYQGRHLVFVIESRNGWLHGYYGVNGIYEFDSMTQKEPYMNDPRCRRLPFKGNHHEISGGSTGKTRIGLHAVRDAFDAIWKYNGAEYPKDFNTAFGIIVVHICESMKLRPVFRRICKAFTDPSVTKLGIDGSDFIERLITSWSYLSGQAMEAIDITGYQINNTRKVPRISSEQDIFEYLAVLYVDGYSRGIFEHDKATYPCHWEPLEGGDGVPSFDDIPYLEKHIDADNGGSDGDQQDGQSDGKQKSEGDGKGRYQGKSKGKRGGEGGRRWGGGDGGGGLGRRQGVSLLASGFPLIGRWSVGQGKKLSVDQNLNELVMQPQDLVCIYMLMCKPPDMSIMEENEYPWCQLIKNRSLTSLSFYTTNLQEQYLGAVAMTLGGDRLSTTETLKWIDTALLGLEDWYLIGWG